MDFEDYLTQFGYTNFVGELDNERYVHSNTIHRFSQDHVEGPIAFYSFELSEPVNAAPDASGNIQDTFSVSAYQQGPTLQNYRKGWDDPTKFNPS